MAFIALGFVFGAWLLQQQSALPSLYWLFMLPMDLIAGCLLRQRFKLGWQYSFLFLLAVCVGFLYSAGFAHYRLHDELPKAWEQQDVEVVGVVASLPKNNARSERFRFDVERVTTLGAQVPKHISLNHYHANAWQSSLNTKQAQPLEFAVGQRWRLTVRLKRPHTTYNPHGYDFEAWALAENIRAAGYVRNKSEMQKITNFVWRPSYFIEYCRGKVGDRIIGVLGNQPYAGVIRALVIGDHSQIDVEDWDVYLRTGTSHLMSISGLHITMLAGLAFGFVSYCWRRLPQLALQVPTRKAAIIGGALTALLYACLAGLSVPTQRTLYMLTTFSVALLLNRHVPMSRVLVIALLVVVLLDPWAVIAPGFWLSFSAVAVITYAAVNRLKVRHWLVEAASTQWAVTLGLLPFLILMFGQASLISPMANAIAIPIISLLVVPLAILGALMPFDFILHAAQKVLALCMHGLDWLSSSPLAIWQQAAAPAWTILFALLGVLWLLLPRGVPQRWLGLLLVLPMLLVKPMTLNQGEMQVTVLDVGQGLAVVVKTASHVLLYDTGPKYNQEKNAGSSIVLPYLRRQGVEQLDTMVVSHDDSDHSGGAAILLAELPVTTFMSSYTLTSDIESMPTQQQCVAGQKWVWDDVQFEILYPDMDSYQDIGMKDNNKSCVMQVTSRYGTVLLTGDIEKSAESTLLESYPTTLRSDVMVAPHHGSKTSSTDDLVRAVKAKHVIFTAGYLNRFKHPKPFIVNRYKENNSIVYRSDYNGAVIIDFTQQHPIRLNSWRLSHAKYWHDAFL